MEVKKKRRRFSRAYIFFPLYFFSIVFVAGVVWTAHSYGRQVEAQYAYADEMIVLDMEDNDLAVERLLRSEEYVSFLISEGLDSTFATELLETSRIAYVEGRYADVWDDNEILKEISLTIHEDEQKRLFAESILKRFKDSLEGAKKEKVVVDDIEKELLEIEKLIGEKRYDDFGGRLKDQEVLLVKAVEAKKEADRKVAEEARKRAAQVADVAAQSNGSVTYERKGVVTSRGTFTADILRVDLSRGWVRTFVAAEEDCTRDCAVKPLASYVAENGGIAGINGTYFCPPDYGHCSNKKNSFDLLVFDYRSKKYFNSGNNQYSTNPLVNFYTGRANFYSQALGFGRDGGASGVISNFPAVVNNGSLVGADSDKGTRGGIGFNGSIVWAVIVRNASFADLGAVFLALGANNAINLDGGGSSAMIFNGEYRVGPGRLLPNAVVFGG